MSSFKNRFSYNQAVNGGIGDGVVQVANFPAPRNASEVAVPPIYYHESQRPNGSAAIPIIIGPTEDLIRIDSLDWLLPGEELKHKELHVAYERPDKENSVIFGRVFVTNYRLRFSGDRRGTSQEEVVFDVTLGSISKVEKIGYRKVRTTALNSDPYGIDIFCKDLRNVRFIHQRHAHGRRALFECLQKYAFPNSNRLPFFATLYKEHFKHDGWLLYDVVSEFERQKVPNHAWRMSRINEEYEFAGTYPALFFVPNDVFKRLEPDVFLSSVSEFRSKKRIPVLSWINCLSCAALVRSSQPLVGALSRKSESDAEYLEMIVKANRNSKSLVILDARPKINARANKANGGGYEDYQFCNIQFMDIQNIHAVRDSLRRLKDACFPRIRQKYFQKTLEETKWLSHLQTILEAAALAAREISINRNSVLVHCSDGWDRTAQITSLAMLQLDPYYRTVEGFAVLVEKEWCSFGHKFAHRIGHGQDKPNDGERSPIFVQFIDCVWQLFNQFITAFEFNVRFLKLILDELYSCRFGTFLYNCERERQDLEVKHNTVSLWSYMLDNRQWFVNEKYNPKATLNDFVSQRTLVYPLFWTDYYCRYSQLVPQENEEAIAGSKPSTPISNVVHNHFMMEGLRREMICKIDEETGGTGKNRPPPSPPAALPRRQTVNGPTSPASRQLVAELKRSQQHSIRVNSSRRSPSTSDSKSPSRSPSSTLSSSEHVTRV